LLNSPHEFGREIYVHVIRRSTENYSVAFTVIGCFFGGAANTLLSRFRSLVVVLGGIGTVPLFYLLFARLVVDEEPRRLDLRDRFYLRYLLVANLRAHSLRFFQSCAGVFPDVFRGGGRGDLLRSFIIYSGTFFSALWH